MLADVGSVGQASTIETHQMPTAFPRQIVPEAVKIAGKINEVNG